MGKSKEVFMEQRERELRDIDADYQYKEWCEQQTPKTSETVRDWADQLENDLNEYKAK